MALIFQCPKCAHEIVTNYLDVGESMVCPSCGSLTTIPESAKEGEAPPVVPSRSIPPTYAGFWRRFFAFLLDGLVIAIPWSPVPLFLTYVRQAELSRYDQLLLMIGALIVDCIYNASMNSSRFQATVGKMLMRCYVADVSGGRISFLTGTLRYIYRHLSGLLLNTGYLLILFTKKKQGLHDFIAQTVVVKRPPYYSSASITFENE
jgi:uncharacterized RDD family membrane protein YckC